MKALRSLGRALVLLVEWWVALGLLSYLAITTGGPRLGALGVYGPLIGSFFLTKWFRGWLRRRREPAVAPLRGQEGEQR